MSGRSWAIVGAVSVVVLLVGITVFSWQQASSANASRRRAESNSSNQVLDLQVDLRRAKATIASDNQQLNQESDAVAQLQSQISGKTSEIETSQETVDQQSANVTAKAHALDVREIALNNLSKSLTTKANELNSSQTLQAAAQAQINTQLAQLQQQEQQFQQQQQAAATTQPG